MKYTTLFIFFLFTFTDIHSQTASVFELMQRDSIVDLYVKMNWKEFEKKKMDKAYVAGELHFQKRDGNILSLTVNVRARGNMRLNICTFPPVKLKFNKGELSSLQLKPLNEIDLVHHCHSGDQYEQFVLREYLAYKLYQQLSPYSYKVQLVRIHYVDENGITYRESCIGYVVENSEELVARLGATRNKTSTMTYNALDKPTMLRVCLFEYMIGNTDWAVKNRHNLEFIGVPGIPFLVAVPFDFDYSGLVGAPYAAHHASIKLPSVTVRYYQGKCAPPEEVKNVISEFVQKKKDLLHLCNTIPGMDERSKKYATDYLTEFFTIIENPKKVENQILSHCDMWPAEN